MGSHQKSEVLQTHRQIDSFSLEMSWIWCIHPYIFDNLFNHIPFWNTTCPRSSMGISYVNMQLRCSQRWLIPCNEKSSSMILYRFIMFLSPACLILIHNHPHFCWFFTRSVVSSAGDNLEALGLPILADETLQLVEFRWPLSGGADVFFPNLNYSDYSNRYIYIRLYVYVNHR